MRILTLELALAMIPKDVSERYERRNPRTGKYEPIFEKILDVLISDVNELEFHTTRVVNLLKRERIKYVWELMEKRHDDLLKITGFGGNSLEDVEDALREFDLSLGTEFSPELKTVIMLKMPPKKTRNFPSKREIQQAIDRLTAVLNNYDDEEARQTAVNDLSTKRPR